MEWLSVIIKRWLRNRLGELRATRIWKYVQIRLDARLTVKYATGGDSYQALFRSSSPGLHVKVDRRVWDRAASRLPQEFSIPNPATVETLSPFLADHYGALFSNPKPMFGMIVDASVWKPIKAALPDSYVLPDPSSVHILQHCKKPAES